MELVGDLYKGLPDAVKSGRVSQAEVDRAVRRVLTLKLQVLGFVSPGTDGPTG
jgi:beta-glucosidase-like glycosyl hydrolase